MINRLFTFGCLLFLGTGLQVQSKDFQKEYESTSSKLKHKSLTLEISLPGKSYFLGELIPVTFRFEDKKNTGRFTVWTGSYDRSGRIGSVSFFVDAGEEETKDPLAVYFGNGIFMGGGIGNTHELGEYERVFHLNEWVRFEKPGTYRFYATSSRVSEKLEEGSKTPDLASSIVEIEIREPTEEELAEAYEKAEEAYAPDDYSKREETYEALSRLRFLDSEKSRLRLRRMLGEADGGEFAAMLGLVGTRDVNATIQLLKEGIQDPEIPVTQNYLNALSKLRVTEKFYERTAEEREKARFTGGWGSMNHLGAPEDWNLLLNSFSQKTERAKAVCALSIFQLIRGEQRQVEARAEHSRKGILSIDRESESILDHEKTLQRIRKPLAEVFTELKREEKERLLEDCWELIKSPAMIEPLQNIVDTPLEREENARSNGIHSWALLRHAEMKPDIAHPIIRREIRKIQPMYSLPPLRLLPDGLSQADLDLLVKNLSVQGNDIERIAGLIEHYGDESIYEPVKDFYLSREGRWACAIQRYFLLYLNRVNRTEGIDLSFQALDLREKTGCYRSTVIDVFDEVYEEDLKERMVEAILAEREPEVIVNFARFVMKHPSAAAVDAMLTQLERLDPKAVENDYSYDTEAGAHREVATLLIRMGSPDEWDNSGRRWDLNTEQLVRLRENIVSDKLRARFESAFGEG